MKLIKKIAAIMFAFMMVFSLSTNVKATSGSQTDGNKGAITIRNAIKGEKYEIYKILDLESYSYDTDKEDGAYSYKLTRDNWANFFRTGGPGNKFVSIDGEYVKWKVNANKEAQAAELAKEALKYAEDSNNGVVAVTASSTTQDNGDGTETLTYTDLGLGYYLVDSSVGALCCLTTTNHEAEIFEKNEKPNLKKYVNTYQAWHPNYADSNSLNKNTTNEIGDTVCFTAEIDNFKGAENLVFTDIMDKGLSLCVGEHNHFLPHVNLVKKTAIENVTNEDVIELSMSTDWNTNVTTEGEKDKFTLEFTDEGYKKLERNYADYVLRISYYATVNKNAELNNVNTAQLNYGDSPNAIISTANVGVLSIPVLKTTINNNGLKGAVFSLYAKSEDANNGENPIEFKKDNELNETYRKATNDETATVHEITTNDTGAFIFYGLKEGKYYLKEIKAPEGYNKLNKSIIVTVKKVEDEAKNITGYSLDYIYGETREDGADKVKVINKTGSLLPSTGGKGTTLIYLIGGALVLGSGFVLANKKRAKSK